MVIEFVTELPAPEHHGPLTRHAENKVFAQALRDNPDTWAKYPRTIKDPISYHSRISRGEAAAFGQGFDAEVRGGEIFVKYVGGVN